MSLRPSKFIIAMLLGASAASSAAISQMPQTFDAAEAKKLIPARFRSDCMIKGNISINSGEKIFNVPSQERYIET